MSEYTKGRIPERNETAAYQEIEEGISAPETVPAGEYTHYRETTDNEGRNFSEEHKKKIRDVLSTLTAGLATAIAAAAVGITGLININMSARFREVDYQDGTIRYTVSVQNMTEKETLQAVLSCGDRIVCTENLTDPDGNGIISGTIRMDEDTVDAALDPDTGKGKFRLSLSGDVGLSVERKFDSYLLEIGQMESYFDSISGECHCAVDGCYHFRMNFRDDKGLFSDFSAKIEDKYGNSSQCRFTEDLHGEQTIFVTTLQGTEATLTISYLADGEPQTQIIDIKL